MRRWFRRRPFRAGRRMVWKEPCDQKSPATSAARTRWPRVVPATNGQWRADQRFENGEIPSVAFTLFLQTHKDVVRLDAHLEPGMDNGPIRLMFPRAHIELPAVPGTGHNAAAQFSLPQRPSLMRADSIQCKD